MLRLIFTARHHPWDWGVRWLTKSRASHVGFALGPTGNPLVHATAEGVVIEPRSAWINGRYVVAEYEIVPDMTAEFASRVLPKVGQPFAYGTIAMRGLESLLRTVSWPTIRLPAANGSGTHVCSQLVMLLDPRGEKIPEWREINAGAATPEDLLRAAEQGLSFRRIA